MRLALTTSVLLITIALGAPAAASAQTWEAGERASFVLQPRPELRYRVDVTVPAGVYYRFNNGRFGYGIRDAADPENPCAGYGTNEYLTGRTLRGALDSIPAHVQARGRTGRGRGDTRWREFRVFPGVNEFYAVAPSLKVRAKTGKTLYYGFAVSSNCTTVAAAKASAASVRLTRIG